MNNFIKKLALLCVSLIFILNLLEYIVDSGLKKEKSSYWGLQSDIYNGRINADLLVLGGSVAGTGLSPTILDSVLNRNSYIISSYCSNSRLIYGRLRFQNEHNKLPNDIIITVDQHILDAKINKQIVNYEQFLPYINDEAIHSIVRNAQSKWIDFYIPFVKYRSEYSTIKKGLHTFLFGPNQSTVWAKGYYPDPDSFWDDQTLSFFKRDIGINGNIPLDTASINELEDLVRFCKFHSIGVTFVVTPAYLPDQKLFRNRTEMISFFQAFAQKNNCDFIDYSDDTICSDRKNFYDFLHLNKTGSEKFSKKLANDLKPLLQANESKFYCDIPPTTGLNILNIQSL